MGSTPDSQPLTYTFFDILSFAKILHKPENIVPLLKQKALSDRYHLPVAKLREFATFPNINCVNYLVVVND